MFANADLSGSSGIRAKTLIDKIPYMQITLRRVEVYLAECCWRRVLGAHHVLHSVDVARQRGAAAVTACNVPGREGRRCGKQATRAKQFNCHSQSESQIHQVNVIYRIIPGAHLPIWHPKF